MSDIFSDTINTLFGNFFKGIGEAVVIFLIGIIFLILVCLGFLVFYGVRWLIERREGGARL